MKRLDSMTFVTIKRLVDDTRHLIGMLPPNIAAVVGIARSGLLPAGLIACNRHRPLYSATRQGFVIPCGCGFRLGNGYYKGGDVLLVDDTVCGGATLASVIPAVRGVFPNAKIITAALYVTKRGSQSVDYMAVELESPHYLEWNLFNSSMIMGAAVDFDGILCSDCTAQNDDDGERYRTFLDTVPPLYIPRKTRLEAIVTARLQKYRPQTEAWLNRWGIRTKRLIMGPWPTIKERRSAGPIAKWKAEQFTRLGLQLFIESDPTQAEQISRLTGRRVLCPAAEKVFVSGV